MRILRWTREGTLGFPWSPHENVEKLALTPSLRERLERTAAAFRDGRDAYHSVKLCWRRGIFFFGPSGAGKTAASRALARALNWEHLTIPAHEILDSHLFERALAEAISRDKRVIVLEDVDQIVKHMEPEVFFTLLDHALERADGTFWVANSRHPEDTPKTQLIRPGRFDESIRLELPNPALRREILMNDFVVPFFSTLSEDDEKLLAELVEQTEGLSFSHFEEMRQIVANLKLEKREAEFWQIVRVYIQDQIIAGDRWGGLSDSTHQLEERIRHVDSRVLQAALDMSDVFRGLMEKVLGDAAAQARQTQNEEGNRSG
jgi:SpoVK/Ycf46/Vps4 family AAA+-type ATPase